MIKYFIFVVSQTSKMIALVHIDKVVLISDKKQGASILGLSIYKFNRLLSTGKPFGLNGIFVYQNIDILKTKRGSLIKRGNPEYLLYGKKEKQ